jgi:peptide/nickel transport system permease protein
MSADRMSVADATATPLGRPSHVRHAILRLDLSLTAWIGVTMATLCVAIGLFGPFFAPHNPDALIGPALGSPSHGYPLGFDYLGRDALSRFLWGGRTAIFLAALGFAFGALGGLAVGLFCAYSRGRIDAVVNWTTEVVVGFPSLILMLILIAALGAKDWVIVVALAVVHLPRVTRIVRAAGVDVSSMAYVEVAEARGERRSFIMFREMLPGVMPVFLVDAGIRIPASILLVASLSFLGLGVQPPTSDWGLIISENREGFTTQPWAVVAPIAALAILMIGVNLAVDGLQRERSLAARRMPGR